MNPRATYRSGCNNFPSVEENLEWNGIRGNPSLRPTCARGVRIRRNALQKSFVAMQSQFEIVDHSRRTTDCISHRLRMSQNQASCVVQKARVQIGASMIFPVKIQFGNSTKHSRHDSRHRNAHDKKKMSSGIKLFVQNGEMDIDKSVISGLDLSYRPLKGCTALFEFSEPQTLPRGSQAAFLYVEYDSIYSYEGALSLNRFGGEEIANFSVLAVEQWLTAHDLKEMASTGLELWLWRWPWHLINIPQLRQALSLLAIFFRLVAMISVPMQFLSYLAPGVTSFFFGWLQSIFMAIHPLRIIGWFFSWLWSLTWPWFLALLLPTVALFPYWSPLLLVGAVFSGTLYSGVAVILGFFVAQEIFSLYKHIKRITGYVSMLKSIPKLLLRSAGRAALSAKDKNKSE
jgi:hypothetical protein